MAHKTKLGNNSKAPIQLEYRFAAMLRLAGFRRAKRIIKEQHDSRPDVDLPEIPGLAIDTKYSARGFKEHTRFMDEVETYVGARRKGSKESYVQAAMPIRPGGSRDILVVVRAEMFIELLQHKYLRNKTGAWGCMRCGEAVEKTGEFGNQHHYKCPTCGLCCSTDQTPDPIEDGIIASRRDKLRGTTPKTMRSVIKDHSDEPEAAASVPTLPGNYQPVTGQLSLTDLVKRKQEIAAKPSKPTRARKPKEPTV